MSVHSPADVSNSERADGVRVVQLNLFRRLHPLSNICSAEGDGPIARAAEIALVTAAGTLVEGSKY